MHDPRTPKDVQVLTRQITALSDGQKETSTILLATHDHRMDNSAIQVSHVQGRSFGNSYKMGHQH